MTNETLDRRKALTYLGALGGVIGLGGAQALLAGTAPAGPAASPMAKVPWPYVPLDPDTAAQRAFVAYGRGHCMYGSFEAIVGTTAERLGAPYTAFPFDMFVYGMGGVRGWGTLCGALNGAAAAVQLLSANPEPVIDALFRWYEGAHLPDFDPKGRKFPNVQSVAGSPLCHASIAQWCEASGKRAYSKEREERCGVLAASVTRKCVELLNLQATGKALPAAAAGARTKACMGCHEKGGALENMRTKMDCDACHTDAALDAKGHPKVQI